MRYAIICSICLLALTGLSAQSGMPSTVFTTLNRQEKPSPWEATKIEFYEVDMYSGQVNITLPIETYTIDHVDLSTSIRYKQGIRNDDLPEETGLQWQLLCGGGISARIVGLNDRNATYRYYDAPYDIHTDNTVKDRNGNTVIEAHLAQVEYAQRDVGPDIYTFHFGGQQVVFFYEQQQGSAPPILQISNSGYKVEHNNQHAHNLEWIVTDPYGNKYYIGGAGYTAKAYFPGNMIWTSNNDLIYGNQETINNWYIRQIITARGHRIEMTYSAPHIIAYSLLERPSRNMFQPYPNIGIGEQQTHYKPEKRVLTQVRVYHGTSVIRKFDYEYDNITISPGSNAGTTPRLKRLLSEEGTVNKAYGFQYVSHSAGGWTKYQLDRVQESSQSGSVSELLYDFDYQEGPLVFGNSYDYWGYYNGRNNAGASYTASQGFLYPGNIKDGVYTGGANRDPVPALMTSGCLSSIRYKTGGVVSLEFEAHRFQDSYGMGFDRGGGLRLLSMTNSAGDLKRYEYGYGGQTAGVLRVAPVNKHYYYTFEEFGPPKGGKMFCRIFYVLSDKLLQPYDVHPVTYDIATVYQGQNGEYGKAEYRYEYGGADLPAVLSLNNFERPVVSRWTKDFGVQEDPQYAKQFRSGQKYCKQLIGGDTYMTPDEQAQNPRFATMGFPLDLLLPDYQDILLGDLSPRLASVRYYESQSSGFRLQKETIHQSYSRFYSIDTRFAYIDFSGLPGGGLPQSSYAHTALVNRMVSPWNGTYFPLLFVATTPVKVKYTGQRVQSLTVEKESYEYHAGQQQSTSYYGYDLPTARLRQHDITVGGKTLSKTYAYADNLGISALTSRNYIGVPLEEKTSGLLVAGIKREYTIHNNQVLLHKLYDLDRLSNTWVLATELSNYDANGNPQQYRDRQMMTGSAAIAILYNPSGMPYRVTWNDRITNYLYSGLKVSHIYPFDQQNESYQYDGLGRLSKIISRGGNIQESISYNIYDNGPNSRISHEYQLTGSSYQVNKHNFVDPLGRPVLSFEKGYNYMSSTEYGPFGSVVAEKDGKSTYQVAHQYAYTFPPRKIKSQASGWPRFETYSYGISQSAINGWPAYSLLKTTTTDENGRLSDRYTDFLGRVVRTVDNQGGLNRVTDYAYDNGGNVQSVVCGSNNFSYTYDGLNRLVARTIPGQTGSHTITPLGNTDLVYKTKDPKNQETTYEYTIYGELDKVYHGATLVRDIDYGISGPSGGRVTVDRSKILGTAGWITTTNSGYDSYGRVTSASIAHGVLGTIGRSYTYDLLDNVTATTVSGPLSYSRGHMYDVYQRPIAEKLNGMTTATYTYNSIDQVVTKSLGSPVFHTVSYKYNIRDWMTQINQVRTCKNMKSDPYTLSSLLPSDPGSLEEGTILLRFDPVKLGGDQPTAIGVEYDRKITINDTVTNEYRYEFAVPLGGFMGGTETYTDSVTVTYAGAYPGTGMAMLLTSQLLAPAGITSPQRKQEVFGGVKDKFDKEVPGQEFGCNIYELFSEEIYYQEGNNQVSASPQFNGNISYVRWQNPQKIGAYGYTYDGLDRLRQSNYAEVEIQGTPYIRAGDYKNFGRYDEHISAYDATGNILGIGRSGAQNSAGTVFGPIDQLTGFVYANNRLTTLQESSDINRGFIKSAVPVSFTYDVNGNMLTAPHKGVASVTYNHLNLPQIILFSDNSRLHVNYDASGNKVSTEYFESSGAGPLRASYYEQMVIEGGLMKAIGFREGVMGRLPNGDMGYLYSLRDHLGSTRVVVRDKNGDGQISLQPAAGELLQVQDYYAYGLAHDQPAANDPAGDIAPYAWRYNHKEWAHRSRLNWYDYGARWYDPAIGRWSTVDPMTGAMPGWSSYSYCFANPVRYTDPNGMTPFPPDDFQGTAWIDSDGVFNRTDANSSWQWSSHSGRDMGYVSSQPTITSTPPGPMEYAVNRYGESISSMGGQAQTMVSQGWSLAGQVFSMLSSLSMGKVNGIEILGVARILGGIMKDRMGSADVIIDIGSGDFPILMGAGGASQWMPGTIQTAKLIFDGVDLFPVVQENLSEKIPGRTESGIDTFYMNGRPFKRSMFYDSRGGTTRTFQSLEKN